MKEEKVALCRHLAHYSNNFRRSSFLLRAILKILFWVHSDQQAWPAEHFHRAVKDHSIIDAGIGQVIFCLRVPLRTAEMNARVPAISVSRVARDAELVDTTDFLDCSCPLSFLSYRGWSLASKMHLDLSSERIHGKGEAFSWTRFLSTE